MTRVKIQCILQQASDELSCRFLKAGRYQDKSSTQHKMSHSQTPCVATKLTSLMQSLSEREKKDFAP